MSARWFRRLTPHASSSVPENLQDRVGNEEWRRIVFHRCRRLRLLCCHPIIEMAIQQVGSKKRGSRGRKIFQSFDNVVTVIPSFEVFEMMRAVHTSAPVRSILLLSSSRERASKKKRKKKKRIQEAMIVEAKGDLT